MAHVASSQVLDHGQRTHMRCPLTGAIVPVGSTETLTAAIRGGGVAKAKRKKRSPKRLGR